MTDMTANEMMKRIVESLKENNAELAREQQAEQNARLRQIGLICLIFASGIAAGALLVTALRVA